MILLTLFSALFISSVAAWFSIAGLIAIFPGAPVAVGLMGSALELGKLVAASWIYRFWTKTNILMRTYFISAIVVLSFITSIGVFGYLTRAYAEGTEGLDANTEQIALLDAQISIEQDNVNVSRTTLQQLDKAVSNLNDSSRVERAIQVRNSQRRERTDLNSTIATSNQKIAELKKQKAELSEKAATRPEGSGTVAALDSGIHSIGKKILEEAGEVWLAARLGRRLAAHCRRRGRTSGHARGPCRPGASRWGRCKCRCEFY